MVTITCSAVVMDIEGTISPAQYVYDVLFPYAREHLSDWIAGHPDDPATQKAVAEVAAGLGVPVSDTDAVVDQLQAWIDADMKTPPLKTLQGLIWQDAYANGSLTSILFDDVSGTLADWYADGVTLAIYSSGSVAAQRALLAHTPQGDVTATISAYFDLTTAGPKREAGSYQRIAEQLRVAAGSILFLSDIEEELAAARAAGWQTVGLLRAGETQATAVVDPVVATFAEIALRTP